MNQVKYAGCTKSCNDVRPVGISNPETNLYELCKPLPAINHASASSDDKSTSQNKRMNVTLQETHRIKRSFIRFATCLKMLKENVEEAALTITNKY